MDSRRRLRTLAVSAVLLFVAATAIHSAASAAPARGGVLLRASGTGQKNTPSFRVSGAWRIQWSYSHCEIPGFDIYVKGADDDLMSVQWNSGHGTQFEYSTGKVYLATNTACRWQITVLAGGATYKGQGSSWGGNGIMNSARFQVPSDWKIHYKYWGCQISGFDIYVHGDVDDIMSVQGKKGHGTQFEHEGGTVYLSTNSACNWQIAIS